MERIRLLGAALLLVVGLFGCGKQAVVGPQQLVILIDVSDSIEPAAEEQAFSAIDRVIAQRQRGDRIAVIPITGDAQAESSGRVIRFEVPTVRQAYDNDLRDFRNKLKRSLEEFKAAAMASPGSRTDILGAVSLAQQEFKFRAGSARKSLVILSDFIQDDSELNFLKDRRLASKAVAKEFGMQSAKAAAIDLREAPVYLGLLRSKDYKAVGRNRREAILEFWVEYFNSSGAQTDLAVDGTGLLDGFINPVR
jgi:von Willebrand factor type A domain